MCKVIFTILMTILVMHSLNISTEYVLEKEYHVVKTGQTLWEIAGMHMGKQDRTEDIRVMIDYIQEANHLDGKRHIMPGDCLEIPLYKELKK